MERKCCATCRSCLRRGTLYICTNFSSDKQFTTPDHVCGYWEQYEYKEMDE